MTPMNLNLPAIGSWDELDQMLGEFASLTNELERVSSKKTAQIQKLKAELQEETADLEASIRGMNQLMDLYVRSRMEDILAQNRKSIKLKNGIVKTSSINVISYPDQEYLIEQLKRMKLLECIKVDESVRKSILKVKIESDPQLAEDLGIEMSQETNIKYDVA
jgi:hypothetical protein